MLNLHSRRSRFHLGSTIICALLLALLTVSCRRGSVVTDSPSAKTAAPVAKVAANTAPTPGPTIQPVGPVGQTPTPRANVPSQIPASKVLTESTESAKAMPMPTPTPTPKPQPTPTVVMKDGKIVQQWQAPAEAASLTNPFQGQAEAVKLGREYFMQRCEACHGKEGKGNGWMIANLKMTPTNLTSTVAQANTDGELFWKITNGRSPMPANRVRFTDEQRWQIVTFLRTLK